MRKIILNVAVSLDGFIEGSNGEYDWCFTDQDYGMEAFTASTDAIFIGRKSYALIAGENNPYFDKKLYIFSDTLAGVEGNAEIIRTKDFVDRIEQVRHEDGKDIWLFGGASLVSAFTQHNYIYEMLLSVHPIILGSGKQLFENLSDRIHLTLLNTEVFSSGLVQLRYTIKPKI